MDALYQVKHNGPTYPWSLHMEVHYLRPTGSTFEACAVDCPDRIQGTVGIFDVAATGLLFRGKYPGVSEALKRLVFHALAGLEYGKFDPYNNALPVEAVEIMLSRMSDEEVRFLLADGSLLCETMNALKNAVDAAVSEAIRFAAEEIIPAANDIQAQEILLKAEDEISVLSMARDRAASGGWPEPKTPGDFLMWIEDEKNVQEDINDPDGKGYILSLSILAMRLRSLGITPANLPWFQVTTAISGGDIAEAMAV